MIRNDDELTVVRDQLSRAEAALVSLRNDVLPKNKQMYEMMSESYVDTILQLRGEVDAYLGINLIPEKADLIISLEGTHVGLGHTSAALVTRFVDTFRRGIQTAVEMVDNVATANVGRRKPRWIERICDLPIVGLAPGSVKVMLAEPEDQSLFSEQNRETLQKALDLVFSGLGWAGADERELLSHPFARLPDEDRQAILALVTQLLPPRTGDVQRVSFSRRGDNISKKELQSATLTRDSRERIRSAFEKMVPNAEFKEIAGVIRKLDLDDRSFTLRERSDGGADLRCEYGPELEEAVKEFLDSRVAVTGTLEINRKQKEKLLADSLEPLVDDDGHSESDSPQLDL